MLGKIASHLAHSENKSCPPRTAVMAMLHSDVTSDAILGTVNRLGKCNDELKFRTIFISNQNGIYRVSDVPYRTLSMHLCTGISEISLGCDY